jgi:hypothetical protein
MPLLHVLSRVLVGQDELEARTPEKHDSFDAFSEGLRAQQNTPAGPKRDELEKKRQAMVDGLAQPKP